MDPSLVNPAACSTTLATLSAPQYSLSEAIEQLYQYIYKYGDESSKQQALLCKIYYLCFHDRYEEARDLLLMSKIQDQISTMTIDTAVWILRNIHRRRSYSIAPLLNSVFVPSAREISTNARHLSLISAM